MVHPTICSLVQCNTKLNRIIVVDRVALHQRTKLPLHVNWVENLNWTTIAINRMCSEDENRALVYCLLNNWLLQSPRSCLNACFFILYNFHTNILGFLNKIYRKALRFHCNYYIPTNITPDITKFQNTLLHTHLWTHFTDSQLGMFEF